MKAFKLIFIALLVISCASIHITDDFEKGTDFSKYKTYNYYSDMETGLSALDNKRLLAALDAKLQSRGFMLSEAPDFFINIRSKEYLDQQRNTVGVGVGGSNRNIGGGISVGIPLGNSKIARQIIFEFIDENSIGLFWQAVSESSYNPNSTPEKRELHLKNIVEKVLKKYPPNSN